MSIFALSLRNGMAYAERAGFDANLFSGHWLRSGFLTSAATKGASIFKMTDVSRHNRHAAA